MASHFDQSSTLYELSRSQFEYFDPRYGHPVFMENAGGSQVPRSVTAAITHYMSHSYAQLGAGHDVSARADATVSAARHLMSTLLNAHGCGQVALGPSTSRLIQSLAQCYASVLGPRDEVIIQESSHESNVGPWVRLGQRQGCKVRTWKLDAEAMRCEVQDLEQLLSPATRIIALSHVSNLLGEVLDLSCVMRLVRQRAPRARVVVDGVAYAPHRAVDVAASGVDFYAVSNYKIMGPHMATLFVSDAAARELVEEGGTQQGPNHYFVPPTNLVYCLELGGVSHEGCAGILGLQQYLQLLAMPDGSRSDANLIHPLGFGSSPASFITRHEVEAAYAAMQLMEQAPQQLLLDFLSVQPDVKIIGPRHAPLDFSNDSAKQPTNRVPTISFVHNRIPPSRVAASINAEGFAVRSGHMYARRLVEALVAAKVLLPSNDSTGADAEDNTVNEGVVRISLLHYNTIAEVERLLRVLKGILNP